MTRGSTINSNNNLEIIFEIEGKQFNLELTQKDMKELNMWQSAIENRRK
ncbi:hypothetical protein [Bacillus sp. OAE603]